MAAKSALSFAVKEFGFGHTSVGKKRQEKIQDAPVQAHAGGRGSFLSASTLAATAVASTNDAVAVPHATISLDVAVTAAEEQVQGNAPPTPHERHHKLSPPPPCPTG